VRRLSLDHNSRTSIALVEVLLRDLWRADPETRVRPPSPEGVVQGFDGALIIGDPALRVDRERFEIVDLAAAWRRLTGRPFVFAVWATRPGIDPECLREPLERSLEAGLSDLDAMVAEASVELDLDPSVLRTYLSENLSFDLGAAELAGLFEFYRRAGSHGLVDGDAAAAVLADVAPRRPRAATAASGTPA